MIGLAGVGDLTWFVLQLSSGATPPTPSPADAFYLLSVPVGVAAVLAMGAVGLTGFGRAKVALDAAIAAGSLFIAAWWLVLAPLATDLSSSVLEWLVSFAYPLGDVVTLAVVLAVLSRARRGDAPGLGLVGAALAVNAFADIAFAYLTVAGTYTSGTLLDTCWFGSYLIFALAASEVRAARDEPGSISTAAKPVTVWPVWFSHVPLLLAVAATVRAVPHGSLANTGVLVLMVLMVIVAVVRHGAALSEVATLNRDLNQAVDELAHRERDLMWQALHDPLTGLGNRALFDATLERSVARARRNGTLTAVLYCDLDGFKAVNDTHGHSTGDDLLVSVAGVLTASVRESDTVTRLGGDEFAIVAEDIGAQAQAYDLAAKIADVLQQPMLVAGHQLTISASVGVATTSDSGSADALLRLADMAMYEAKSSGKARAVLRVA